jgi:hypothetical protein
MADDLLALMAAYSIYISARAMRSIAANYLETP